MGIQTKKRIFLSSPHMGGEEPRFVHEAFESNYIAPLGPQVDAFEQEFAQAVGIPHVVALSSGTAAMHLALHILGIGQGDEVFASKGFVPTAVVLEHLWTKVPYLKSACVSDTKNVIVSSIPSHETKAQDSSKQQYIQ